MTQPQRGKRTDQNWVAHGILVLALLLFCWSHRHAPHLTGFADDLGLLAELPTRARDGTLLADVFAKLAGPLWPGSTMWRPLPYASFALDAQLWGNAPGAWRVTNLLLHIGVAAFSGLLAARLAEHRLAAAAAFATVLLAPWVPEVSLWLVGRFDGWATLAIVISLWASTKSSGADRWFVLSLLAAIAAYASKETALILSIWIVLVAVLQNALRSHLALIVAHALLALAYLAWRSKLFADHATAVYASTPEYNMVPLIGRIAAHLAFPAGLAPLASIAAVICALISALLFLLVARDRAARRVAAVGVLMVLSVIAAIAVHFATPPDAGEGYRFYYLATVGLALVVASAMKASGSAAVPILAIFMITLGAWQSRVATEWSRASRTIDAAAHAMTAAATTLAPSEFGLVLMPDMMGHVPVARNAQGALLTLKNGALPARDFFIIFTPPQLAEWHQLSGENVVKKLTARSTAPTNPTRHFCFDSGKQALQDLGHWPTGTLGEWTERWREAVSVRCPGLMH